MNNDNGYILVVDDAQENLQVVGKILREKNYKIGLALNGEQALSQVRTRPPELILLDVQMPGMDGYEVCKQLKADEATKDIPIIFLTAMSEVDNMNEGYDAGGADYVTKPFNPPELLHRIETNLRLSRVQKEVSATKKRLAESQGDA